MAQKSSVSIPADLIPEFEAWGEMTAKLFGRLRRQAGMKPANTPPDQAWFWTDEWQKGEREVDEALANGEYDEFDNVDELIKDLQSHVWPYGDLDHL